MMTRDEAKLQPPEEEIWIDCPMGALDSKFCGNATVSFPYGPSGPAALSVKFNLTAYIKYLIEKGQP